MNLPLVTVVLCTYNGERFLEEQIESILAQTYKNIEIVAVDDCSTDSTATILKSYSNKLNKFHFFLNDKNVGVTKNFEAGILQANGVYIAFADQDDIWHIDKLSVLMASKNNAKLVYSDSELVDEFGERLNKKISDKLNMKSYSDAMPFLITNCISGHAMIIEKRFALQCLPFSNSLIYDRWLAFMAAAEKSIVYVDKPLVYHRQHDSNVIGAVKNSNRKSKNRKTQHNEFREELAFLYERCPEKHQELKSDIRNLLNYIQDYSFKNNFYRFLFFLKKRNGLLAIKKRTALQNLLFSFKKFFKIS